MVTQKQRKAASSGLNGKPCSSEVLLDDRAHQWVRDLQLKAKNHGYLSHPDFLPGYRFAQEVCRDDVLSDPSFSTLKYVIDEIERSLSHSLHRMYTDCSLSGYSHPSYAWCVGSLFGYLALLLQFYPDRFPFLAGPVCHVEAFVTSCYQEAKEGLAAVMGQFEEE